ncbi:MAG TPA: DUF4390 domain-containing protein [Thermoanaerobaculia bacterium]|nr:DUF4390 domain-containing protein [Thermoanaerobaculia bacterium]
MSLPNVVSRAAAGALLAGLFATGAGAAEQEKPRIEALRADARGPDVFVGFRLAGALNPELATKIESGLETVVRYEIRLNRHNAHWLWDDHMDTRKYRVGVTYDPVTREYVVVETMDGHPLQRSTTHNFSEVARHLLSRENLLVFRVRHNDWRTNLYVQMRATFDSGYLFTIIPVDSRTAWKESNRFEIKVAPR